VLESFYEHPRAGIAAALGALISSPGVQISEAAIHLDALDRYRRTKVHFVDCLLAAAARAEDTPSPRSTKISGSFPTFGSKIHKESKGNFPSVPRLRPPAPSPGSKRGRKERH